MQPSGTDGFSTVECSAAQSRTAEASSGKKVVASVVRRAGTRMEMRSSDELATRLQMCKKLQSQGLSGFFCGGFR